MTETILFDLDGTLLPMNMEEFLNAYMEHVGRFCERYGYRARDTVKAIWRGTEAMVANDGTATNDQRFWDAFAEELGEGVLAMRQQLELFYENEFNATRTATQPNPMAAPLVRGLRAAGYKLVLATNPLFPLSAIRTRLAWLGLSVEDFDHVTTYENCHYCKPNPDYFREILAHMGTAPEHALMVGNDVDEDGAAVDAGIDIYFVTDHLDNESGSDISMWESGSFAQVREMLEELARNERAG